MNPYNKQVNTKAIKESKKLQRLLAVNGLSAANSSKALTKKEMQRLFRITPIENKNKAFWDIEGFVSPFEK